ncbi:ADP-ribosylglycohydrolase family protein [Saccharopolyspora indica]|uniref:ADP-ribosylglycohydrolase family protein n=1 Tax=Saccharopolyspora indica TaxID=1229659 RepID=UPI0022EA4C09|nr:ADP-ribosylglycohydrolase family protein [Saccharopolyspora indica]MDA3647247.1 ADP-ribosylglycohydrolase family protein [Saccharopolyspora indica]
MIKNSLDELTPQELKTLQAWRDMKVRPSLLPMSWFVEVDHQVGLVFGGDRKEPLAWPRRQYEVLGRALGMLIGGALGDSLGTTAEAEGITTDRALLTALRFRPWRAPNSAALGAAAEIATRAQADHREGADLDAALMTRAQEAEIAGPLGCFAAAVPAALVSINSADGDAFRRGMRLAALLSDSSADQASAGAFAVALVRALNGHELRLDQLSRLLLEQVGAEHTELRRRLGYLASVGEGTDDQAVFAELGKGSSGAEVVSRALWLGARDTGGWAEVVHAFVGENRSYNAQVSGLLTGARRGAEAFPLLWRRKLEPAARLESVAETFMSEFGPDQVRITPQADVRGAAPSVATPDQDAFVDERAQDRPEDRRVGDVEGGMGQSQGVEMTALERAITRFGAGEGPVEDVYREFLVARTFLITSPGGPAFFQMSDQPKEQIWVCTDESAAPDLGFPGMESPGTTPVNGYRLLPLLAERNVRIITREGVMDLMIIGSRAVQLSAPEITDQVRAEGLKKPGAWLGVPDRMLREQPWESLPAHGVVGEYWVDENGAVTEQYRPNPEYRPSPRTLGFPEPRTELGHTLQLYVTQQVTEQALVKVLNESVIALAAHEDGVPAAFPLHGRPTLVAASVPEYIPDFAKGRVKAAFAEMTPAFTDADLVIDLGTRQQVHFSGQQLLELLAEVKPSGEAAAAQQPAAPLEPHERFVGSMLAGAVGDALGYAVEFHDIGMIRRNHGDAGLTAPVLRDGVAQISDDTQMMLFTLEGLIRAHVARRIKPVDNDPVPEVQHAYQRWFHTQNQPWSQAGGPYAQRIPQPDGWLITNPQLFAARAPGSTCMSALAQFAQTHQHASPQHRVNDSKGCGGVMRAAPVAVWSHDPAEVFYAAVGTAALTHSHPSGYLSAGVLAVIVHQLIRDVPLGQAVSTARELLLRWRGHEEQLALLDKAVELAKQGPVAPEVIKDTLGQGWVGEEALAIGLYAALATDNLRDALLLAVNHSGDSDSTGIVCGNIAGALHGARAVPPEWLGSLELREVIETLAGDALAEFSPGPPTDPAWTRRYPAW